MMKITEKKPSPTQHWILYRMASLNWRICATPCTVALFDAQVWRRSLKGMTFCGLVRSGWIEPDPQGVNQWRISSLGRQAIGSSAEELFGQGRKIEEAGKGAVTP